MQSRRPARDSMSRPFAKWRTMGIRSRAPHLSKSNRKRFSDQNILPFLTNIIHAKCCRKKRQLYHVLTTLHRSTRLLKQCTLIKNLYSLQEVDIAIQKDWMVRYRVNHPLLPTKDFQFNVEAKVNVFRCRAQLPTASICVLHFVYIRTRLTQIRSLSSLYYSWKVNLSTRTFNNQHYKLALDKPEILLVYLRQTWSQ